MKSNIFTIILFIITVLLWVNFIKEIKNIELPRLHPRYSEVDPEVKPYVNQYLSLAKDSKITFTHKVNVGFTDINKIRQGFKTIGKCNYAWREIDLDRDSWNQVTEMTKLTLIFHELSHCYCDRGHDYGDGKSYGTSEDRKTGNTKEEGFFSDECPISLMFPTIVSDECMVSHYSEYISEMFLQCDPY